ncbi:diguanylate cyclase [Moritella sp. 24]|uniref:sensor domain-containing diguanylate cyclase n=1 Tax=Moritella sp. 24 TaxID=2746230 RepID=UPI001BA9CA3A|nr:diguanylate cyclase [Moritella sp. 24]QUM76354.1 diguanylate cyclase [Moritella sp. 24]
MQYKEHFSYLFVIIILITLATLTLVARQSEKAKFIQEYTFIQSELDDISEYLNVIKMSAELFRPINQNIADLYDVRVTARDCLITERNKLVSSSAFMAMAYSEICTRNNSEAAFDLRYALNITQLMINNNPTEKLKSIYFISKKGFVISSLVSDAEFIAVKDFEDILFKRPYIKKFESKSYLPQNAFVITGPYSDIVTHIPMLTFTTALYIESRLVGYLNLDLKVADLQGALCKDCFFSQNKLSENNLSSEFYINEYRTGLYLEKDFSITHLFYKAIKYQYIYIVLVLGSALLLFLRFRIRSEVKKNDLVLSSSYEDEMTGLLNRRGFKNKIKTKMNGNYMAVSIFDIDNFKKINDTFGHLFGDYVIKELSVILQSNVRDDDLICRFGGEEFVVILAVDDISIATEVLERIRTKVESNLFEHDGIRTKVTISCGAFVTHKNLLSINNQFKRELKKADDNLYKAKGAGRNRLEYNIDNRI